MRLFDTKVQLLKYKVLRGVAKRAWEDHLESSYYEIPLEIVPGKEATMRCCIYKERAIVLERIKLAATKTIPMSLKFLTSPVTSVRSVARP